MKTHNRNRLKLIGLLFSILAFVFVIGGCAKQEPVVKTNLEILNELGIEVVEPETLAVIINEPKAEQIEAFSGLFTLNYDENAQKLLIIPTYDDQQIILEQVIWSNNKQDFINGRVIYNSEDTKAGDALYLQAIRPEGMPHLRLLVGDKQQASQYLISYNGKDGTANYEKILASPEGALIWAGVGSTEVDGQAEESEEENNQEIFNYQEISAVFNMTETDITELFGPPTERRTEEFFEGINFLNLYYGNNVFSLDNEEAGYVYSAVIADNQITAPRGIQIGDSLEEVISKYPNDRDEIINDPNDPTYKERILYGEGTYMSDHGKIIYKNEIAHEVIYATKEGATVTFVIENEQVHHVKYQIPMT